MSPVEGNLLLTPVEVALSFVVDPVGLSQLSFKLIHRGAQRLGLRCKLLLHPPRQNKERLKRRPLLAQRATEYERASNRHWVNA